MKHKLPITPSVGCSGTSKRYSRISQTWLKYEALSRNINIKCYYRDLAEVRIANLFVDGYYESLSGFKIIFEFYG